MDFITPGYEDMELSTQILIKEAINRNINVEVMDRKDNFIRLQIEKKIEYIKQATRTSADRYISPLIMENKLVTKQILNEKGINIPNGKSFEDINAAINSYHQFTDIDIVIKPKSTNFGIGITILKKNESKKIYKKAVLEAFKFDSSILIEEFINGKEYRFLIIGDEVIGVLQRIPANIIGDNIHTIKELIYKKNRSPLRGTGYKSPLENIKTGDIEKSFLKLQGKNFNYIPKKNEQIFLRKNSNISTGGDSIDYTDKIPETYKTIALNAARAVGAKFCGADMIIQKIEEKPDNTNYCIIELNFNPAIHIHSFPFKGKNRYPEKKILNLLGF
jgi:glutamate--cysteine ligase/glutathione synthase